MGKKTVRWDKLKLIPGVSSCNKCSCIGLIQEYDWIDGSTRYVYCDCFYGDEEKSKSYVKGKPGRPPLVK